LSVSAAQGDGDDARDKSIGADESSGAPIGALIAGVFGFLLFCAFLVHRIRRLQQSVNLKSRATRADEEQPVPQSRMSFSHRASMSLRMSRLDNIDVENQDADDGAEARRLSAYLNARRKSEVAREDEVNNDIAVEVKKKRDARKQRMKERRAAMHASSGADSCTSEHAGDDVDLGSGSG
jgi:hypothetical protein